MSTRKEQAWRALKIAEDRFSDAAIVIADNLVYAGKQPTAYEIAEYRTATKALVLANSEYANTIQKKGSK